MPIHPIEYRYSNPEMYAVFTEENILEKKLLVEAAIAKAHAKVGTIPEKDAEEIAKHANTKEVTLERVKEIEQETQHDLMAIVKALSEKCGEAGKYVHLGATSYDIVDTSWALLFKEALGIIQKDLQELKRILLESASKHKNLVMAGRTHGQIAVPTTLGLKFAVWAVENQRNITRVEEDLKLIGVGKMTGAVGTGAPLGKNAVKIQDLVMKELGLESPLATTQVIQRDRHAEVILHLAIIGKSLEKIAKEIRNLQRTEIGEISEPFGKKQVGSSTMPQKRNPWKSERICGLARYLSSNVKPALENIPLEHERDLTNSSCERIVFPESFVVCDFILKQACKILDGLVVYPANMKKNLELTKGRVMGEAVMIKLVEKGIGRQEAHELVRTASMKSFEQDTDLKSVLLKEPEISKALSAKEIDEVMKPENYIGSASEFVDNVLKKLG
jgi:adenylosuccinate lyase